MLVSIQNQKTSTQRLMIVSADKHSLSTTEGINDIMNAYKYYDFEQPHLNRDFASLEESTGSIMDSLEFDVATRVMVDSYNPKTNTDSKAADMIRKVASILRDKRKEDGADLSFVKDEEFNPNANIVVDYEPNIGGNPKLELSWWTNNNAFFDSYTHINGQTVAEVSNGEVLELSDIQAVIIKDTDGCLDLLAEENETMGACGTDEANEQWGDSINASLEEFGDSTLYVTFVEYSR